RHEGVHDTDKQGGTATEVGSELTKQEMPRMTTKQWSSTSKIWIFSKLNAPRSIIDRQRCCFVDEARISRDR
ncbi:hypothetical protein Ancab_014695, partial [Ancistrocladus abbreviatus]